MDIINNNIITNTKDLSYLEKIRSKIEKMSSFNQIGVLKILNNYKDNVTLNENNYGVLVNLTDVSDEILDKLEEYIIYINKQEGHIISIENKKEKFKQLYFNDK